MSKPVALTPFWYWLTLLPAYKYPLCPSIDANQRSNIFMHLKFKISFTYRELKYATDIILHNNNFESPTENQTYNKNTTLLHELNSVTKINTLSIISIFTFLLHSHLSFGLFHSSTGYLFNYNNLVTINLFVTRWRFIVHKSIKIYFFTKKFV